MTKLKRHELVHLDVRNRICPTCGKSFKTASNLHQHKEQHKPRKFVCECGDAFTYRHGLKNHQERCSQGLPCKRPHTKNRPQKDNFGNIIPSYPVVSVPVEMGGQTNHSDGMADIASCPISIPLAPPFAHLPVVPPNPTSVLHPALHPPPLPLHLTVGNK